MSRKFQLRKIFGNRSFLEYNPRNFWQTRPDGRGKGNEPWLKDFVELLKKHDCKTLLEIGCGDGCNLAYAKEAINGLECRGFDLSTRHIKAGKQKYPYIKLEEMELKEWRPSQKYDCVLTAGILMHVLPREINKTVKKIKKSTDLVFSYEQASSEYGLRHPNNFVFFHDYDSLFGKDMALLFQKKYETGLVAKAFQKKGSKQN